MKSGKDNLSPKQLRALDSLLAGKTFKEAARDAGVTRKTLFIWRTENPNFRAAYNAACREMEEDVQRRFRTLKPKAMDVIEASLEGGNIKTAWAVVNRPAPSEGSSDPLKLKRDDAHHQLLVDLEEKREMNRLANQAVHETFTGLIGLDPMETAKEMHAALFGSKSSAKKDTNQAGSKPRPTRATKDNQPGQRRRQPQD